MLGVFIACNTFYRQIRTKNAAWKVSEHRVFVGPYFPQSEHGKLRTRENCIDTFSMQGNNWFYYTQEALACSKLKIETLEQEVKDCQI